MVSSEFKKSSTNLWKAIRQIDKVLTNSNYHQIHKYCRCSSQCTAYLALVDHWNPLPCQTKVTLARWYTVHRTLTKMKSCGFADTTNTQISTDQNLKSNSKTFQGSHLKYSSITVMTQSSIFISTSTQITFDNTCEYQALTRTIPLFVNMSFYQPVKWQVTRSSCKLYQELLVTCHLTGW